MSMSHQSPKPNPQPALIMKLPLIFIVICLVLTPGLCGWFRSEPEQSWFEKLTSSWTKEEPKSHWSSNSFSWYGARIFDASIKFKDPRMQTACIEADSNRQRLTSVTRFRGKEPESKPSWIASWFGTSSSLDHNKEPESKSSWSASWFGTSSSHNSVARSQQEPEQQSSWNPLAWIALAATPVVLVKSVISALGFGAAGIAKGSAAATMMSGAAIAAGGGVAKGGLVAWLQSAGVLGLGSAAWPLTIVGLGLGVGYLWLQS